jgi:hypothetical protein
MSPHPMGELRNQLFFFIAAKSLPKITIDGNFWNLRQPL